MLPATWCIDALALALVGARAASELTVQLTTEARAGEWQSFIYGECGLPQLHTLLCVLECHCGLVLEGKTFVDLGHGTGELALSAALLRKWGSVRGVEACAQRFGESERLLARWHVQVAPTLPREQQRLEVVIQLLHGNMLDLRALDWSCADVVYVHATCFDESLIASLIELAGCLKPGAHVVSVGKPLVSDRLQHLFAWGCAMSYSDGGKCTVYISRRRIDASCTRFALPSHT
jgi:SAM-dependent methyltransferase